MEPELIADYECQVGEGPLWHAAEGKIYWDDITRGRIFRYDPATGHHELCYQAPHDIGGFTIQEDGSLLLFESRGAISIWREGQITPVLDEIAGETDGRFNDVIADPAGRVFCGTMPTPNHPGRLYRLDPDRTLTLILDDVDISNGMAFTPDRTGMYHTDSNRRIIDRFDYDEATGALTNRRTIVDSSAEVGLPDGLTIDEEGYIWSARWDGGCLTRYAPDGTEVQRITFPALQVSSAIFGGPDLADLYVTTAGGDNKAANGPGAGALFRLRPGVRGLPEFHSAIRPPMG
jgi:D-xylonolactonase